MNKASIITIGDEILTGQIIDTNSLWLAQFLTKQGMDVVCSVSVPDTKTAIYSALEANSVVSDFIVMTGGLGPTKDDITKQAIADFLGVALYFDEAMYNGIRKYFDRKKFRLTEAHKLQCYLPKGAELLENKMGTAPGMLFDSGKLKIISLPGVPYEMKWIAENSLKKIWNRFQDNKLFIEHITIRTVEMEETDLEKRIEKVVTLLPEDIKVAYLPSLGEVKVRLTAKSKVSRQKELGAYGNEIIQILGNAVYGTGEICLEEALKDLYIEKGKTLSTAESCTGGYIASRLTSVPGSSVYFIGSIIAYSYEIKEKSLKVKKDTLLKYGAVSEETVLEMLAGLLDRMGTDVGIAVSGIAGPGGGTPTKPVGTVWLAWGSRDRMLTEKLQLGKDREKNIIYTAIASMNRLRLFLTD